ncbi:hypothetical protein Tco_0686330 [Tanacetum coccineum]
MLHNRTLIITIFECSYASQVWNRVKTLAGMTHVYPFLEDILDWLIPKSSVLPKLVFAVASYFIWQERNLGIFQKKKRPEDQVVDTIIATVQLKLLSFRFKT